MADERVTTRELIEVVVLAFSRSPAKKSLSPDALRMVLNGAYGSLVPGGRLHLQVVWGLIANLPGLAQDDATPAFCLVKQWEPKLGLGVDMPDHLRALSPTDCAKRASLIPLKDGDLNQLLDPAPAAPAPAGTRTAGAAPDEPDKPAKQRRRERAELTPEQRKKRRYLAIGAGVIALAAFTFSAYTLISNTGGPHYSNGARDLSPIPVKDAKRLGNEVIGTLADDAWLALPEADRKSQLAAALSANDVQSIVILGADRKIRASAQRRGSTGTVVVKFPTP